MDLQIISPPDAFSIATTLIFALAGLVSITLGIAGRLVQKRPLLLPVVIVIVGFFDIGFAIKYAQLTVPSFPGGPVPSVELRPFLLMMSLVVLSVPLGFLYRHNADFRIGGIGFYYARYCGATGAKTAVATACCNCDRWIL